jgi:hypothetical protein
MYKDTSTEFDVILHRTSTKGTTWDFAIGEAELAIKQLKKTLEYLKERKRSGDPFPVTEESTQN